MPLSPKKKKAGGRINIEDKMVISYTTNSLEIKLKLNKSQMELILPQVQKIRTYHNNTYSLPLNYSVETVGKGSYIKFNFIPNSTIYHLSSLKDDGISVTEKYGFEVDVDTWNSQGTGNLSRNDFDKIKLLLEHFLNSVKGLRRIELDENTQTAIFTLKVQHINLYKNSTATVFKELSRLN